MKMTVVNNFETLYFKNFHGVNNFCYLNTG